MAEPIGPEAYLAVATSVQNAVNKYRDTTRAKQKQKLAIISADSSKSSLTLPADELLSHAALKIGNDGHVQWAVGSPAHPRNWSRQRRAYDVGLIFLLEFCMSAVGAAGTPASFYASGDLGHRRELGLVAFTTMYLLGQVLGASLIFPYADKFGRRTLYVASAFLYSLFCLPVAATSNIAGVFVGRFISGLISAVPAVTTRGSLQDLFGAEGRIWALFCWALATNLGVVVGPVYASYVAVSLNWRWTFYLATIIVALTGMLMYFIRESHIAQLLERKVAAVQSHRADLILRTAPTAPCPSVFQPVILFFTKPVVFFSSLTNAFSTALLYLFAVAFPLIYAHYAWNREKSTLIFLFIALGFLLSTLTRFYDRHTARTHRLANRRTSPENRLFGLAIGAPVLAVGLWWFAWTIPGPHVKSVAWPASAISLILIGYGVNEHSTVLPRYVLESRTSKTDAASAFIALFSTRALFSALSPLFTQQMFENLGGNTAGSILAATATVSCLAPLILIHLGPKPRKSGGGSATDDDDDEKPAAKKDKPRKTVRWGGDPARSNAGSDTPSEHLTENENGSASHASSEVVIETAISGSSCAGAEPSPSEDTTTETGEIASESRRENGDEDEKGVGAEGAEVLTRVESKGSRSSSGTKKENEKKAEKKEKETRDDGAIGFLGMGVERLAVLPYF